MRSYHGVNPHVKRMKDRYDALSDKEKLKHSEETLLKFDKKEWYSGGDGDEVWRTELVAKLLGDIVNLRIRIIGKKYCL